VNAKDLDRYRQLLLAKGREIEARAIGTLGATGGATERPADVIDEAADAAQADLQVHLHQTDSHLLRAIEEAVPRQNFIGLKAIDYSGRSLHTPDHDRGDTLAGNCDRSRSPRAP